MRRSVGIVTACLFLFAGCYGGGTRLGRERGRNGTMDEQSGSLPPLAASSWLVSTKSAVWKVLEEAPGGAPRHVGYVTQRTYRQQQGGPGFQVYSVTRLDRRDEIGHVDQMGRAVRYEPRRGGGYDVKDVGQATLEDNVAAIFDTENRIVLEKTTERQLAFESIDANRNGVLDRAEIRMLGDAVASADANHDGVVDVNEFDAIDRL